MEEAAATAVRGSLARGEAPGGGCDRLLRLIEGPVVIRSAREMGVLLWTASPGQARRFALDSHERACERADDDMAEFWHRTLEWLSGLEGAAEGEAA